ncbi:hypothetical protein NDU88_000728 [Pleurodeles waltl]|uniref:Uncharacterized protein n=1 Tax=Pleurodeles waltl TaxID=8319 RepID=A0AAV7VUC9_PLEWA|nr:hypothetical protein NDU88_000728 [Pleurodeles waltl]
MLSRKSGFKQCGADHHAMLVTDPHNVCLWCLDRAHGSKLCSNYFEGTVPEAQGTLAVCRRDSSEVTVTVEEEVVGPLQEPQVLLISLEILRALGEEAQEEVQADFDFTSPVG